MKSVVAIVVACFLLSVGITTAQTQSIPLEQKTPVTPVSRLTASRYQGTSYRKDGRWIAPRVGTDCLFGSKQCWLLNPLLSLSVDNNLESLQDKTFTKNLDSRHCGAKINAQMPVISTVENLALIFLFSE
jgi:hypothetical protein